MRWKPSWSCIFKNFNVKYFEQWTWQYILSRGALTYIVNSNNIFPNSVFFLHYHTDLHIELPHNKRPCLIDGKCKISIRDAKSWQIWKIWKFTSIISWPATRQSLGKASTTKVPSSPPCPLSCHLNKTWTAWIMTKYQQDFFEMRIAWIMTKYQQDFFDVRIAWILRPNLWRGSSGSHGGQSIAEPGSILRTFKQCIHKHLTTCEKSVWLPSSQEQQILHTLMVSNKLWNIKISSKPSRAEPGSILLTSKQFMICVTSYPQRATIYAHWWFPTKWETSPWIFWHQPQHSVQGHHQTHEWGRPGRPDVIHTLKLFEERECKITFSHWGEAGNLEMKHYLI